MTILSRLSRWLKGGMLWWAFIILGISMEAVALYYQYVLEEPPCVLCIHFRLLFVCMIIVSIIGLLVRRYKIGRIIGALALFIISIVLVERSYQLLGTERHFVLGDCGFTLNFPDWIAVDKWFPAMFKPMTSCGYTPDIAFGITMAESLSAFSVVFLLLSVLFLLASLRRDSSHFS